MRLCLAACLYTLLSLVSAAHAAEITNIASSFEQWKIFGFKLSATYGYSFKTARIMRESLAQAQTIPTRQDLLNHYQTQTLDRTELVPDLIYTQRRQTMSLRFDLGLIQAIQFGVEVPLVLIDQRQYDLDQEAGWNRCNTGAWGCVAGSSSTYLDGIYPIEPADQTSSLVLRGPLRGGGGLDMLDTINLSLTASPIYQRRDPSKPTWVIGMEAQISIGTIMEYDNTRLRLPSDSLLVKVSQDRTGDNATRGHNGVSEGLHRIIFRTALSRRFRFVDPYFGLWYMIPVPRTGPESPWVDYGFQNKRQIPQHRAGVNFGFEAIALENKAKGHRLSLDFRGGLTMSFLGRGYSEAWELLAASNALICDGETPLPPPFHPDLGAPNQGTFNPACRTPATENPSGNLPRLATASPYFRNPYTGLTVIENYLSFTAELGILIKLYRHLRIRLSGTYQRDQGHVVTQDDAGTSNYQNRTAGCLADRVDINCPLDWNPTYRAVINQPGRRYRVEDINVITGNAMLQVYY